MRKISKLSFPKFPHTHFGVFLTLTCFQDNPKAESLRYTLRLLRHPPYHDVGCGVVPMGPIYKQHLIVPEFIHTDSRYNPEPVLPNPTSAIP